MCSCKGLGGGGGRGLNDFEFATFSGRFQSDGAASMAVKGLRTCALLFRNTVKKYLWCRNGLVYDKRHKVVLLYEN